MAINILYKTEQVYISSFLNDIKKWCENKYDDLHPYALEILKEIHPNQVSPSYTGNHKFLLKNSNSSELIDVAYTKLPESFQTQSAVLLTQILSCERIDILSNLVFTHRTKSYQKWKTFFIPEGVVFLKNTMPMGFGENENYTEEYIQNWVDENIKLVMNTSESSHSYIVKHKNITQFIQSVLNKDYTQLSRVVGSQPIPTTLTRFFKNPNGFSLKEMDFSK
jgi:hypothetical protein